MSYIAIIDYDLGNVKSIYNALIQADIDVKITKDKQEILNSMGVILPGVGAFAHGMEKLKEHNLVALINEYAESNKPLLGICLGMQILFSTGDEFGLTEGLNLIPGVVTKLTPLNPVYMKLPHISWSEIKVKSNNWSETILSGIESNEDMYFVHSYIAKPKDVEDILSTTVYSDYEFCSSVKRKNIYGCQFHPEKSANQGLRVINNFVNICKR